VRGVNARIEAKRPSSDLASKQGAAEKEKQVAEIVAKEFVTGFFKVVTFTDRVGEIARCIQPDVESNDTSIRTS
jgi:hypothetical protein